MKRALVMALALAMALTGCSVAWLTTFEGYLKIAGPILIQILDIVSLAKGTTPNPALQSKITADAAALQTLANSISTAASANLPNDCAAFNQAVATFAGDLTTIEQLANVGPGTSGEIQAALGIAQAAISEIEVPIAACANSPTSAAAKAVLQSAALKMTSPNDVARRFNAVVDKKHRVHLHSWPMRALSFGHLQ